MTSNKSSNASPAKVSQQQRNISNTVKHSSLYFFSDSLFRNKRLKQKRLKWANTIDKTNKSNRKIINNNNNNNNNFGSSKTDYRRQNKKNTLPALPLPPELTINLLSDDEDDIINNHVPAQVTLASPNVQYPKSLPFPQLVVFPANMQLSNVPNITLIPVQPIPSEIAASLQNRLKHKRKSQKPKRHAEPTLINNESILLSDESNPEAADEVPIPAACSTPNHLDVKNFYNNQTENSPQQLKICSVHSAAITPRIAQVDEEVTVSLVPRCSTGSCSSKVSNSTELFPMVPDETTVQTTIANRIYELSLSKLREGLASSGVGDFNDEQNNHQQPPTTSSRGKGTNYNLPANLTQTSPQPVSLKLSSDLSISLISDDEDDPHQQRLNAEKLLRQQPHLSVRPVGVATTREPPKRRKLG